MMDSKNIAQTIYLMPRMERVDGNGTNGRLAIAEAFALKLAEEPGFDHGAFMEACGVTYPPLNS